MKAHCQSCPWIGPVDRTHHFKHDPDYPLCPECHDAVEVAHGDHPGGPIDYDITLEEPEKGHCFEKYWNSKTGGES